MNVEHIWEGLIAILLASAGRLARLLHIGRNMVWHRILSEVFVSAFAGYMILLTSRLIGLSGDWLGLVCGMAGWMGPRALDIAEIFVARRIGKK